MKADYTQEKYKKLEKYFLSLGNPVIEWKRYHEEWGHKDQEYCTGNIQAIGLCNGLHFRLQGDPHWELREKWILSDFQLPIEFYDEYDRKWADIKTPAWWNELKYREKPSLGEYIPDGMITKDHLYENKGYSASHLIDLANKIREDRGTEYEKEKKEENSFAAVAAAFNAITGKNLSPAEVALLLQILKDVRQWAKPRFHKDSAVDCINYAALKAKLLFEQYEDKK